MSTPGPASEYDLTSLEARRKKGEERVRTSVFGEARHFIFMTFFIPHKNLKSLDVTINPISDRSK